MTRAMLVILAAFLLPSCRTNEAPGDEPGLDGARQAAAAWYQAIATDDGDTACLLMTASMRAKVMTDARVSNCEDGIHRYTATVDGLEKPRMKAGDFSFTPNGPDLVHIRIHGSWRAPTFEVSWTQRRWLIGGVTE